VTQQHPINPPPKLMQQWAEQFEARGSLLSMFEDIYRAGADAELEACCEWLDRNCPSVGAHHLRTERRPKPLSLKEQALEAFDRIKYAPNEAEDFAIIRRALERLPDDQ